MHLEFAPWFGRIASSVGRFFLLLVLVCTGTVLLIRLAPGYAIDLAEMDSAHSFSARVREQAAERQGSSLAGVLSTLGSLGRGKLGQSRQYGLPVRELLQPRLVRSGQLLLLGWLGGWTVAFAAALLRLVSPWTGAGLAALLTVLLALPAGALSTLLLPHSRGSPTLVLLLVVAARDFHFLDALFHEVWTTGPLVHARCSGLGAAALLRTHLLPAAGPRVTALLPLSVVTALGALLPVEVLFDTGGVAQLAWSAAGNRDLPVLVAITLLLAAAVVFIGSLTEKTAATERQ